MLSLTVEQCVSVIQSNADYLRLDRNMGLKSLNRPEGSVSAAAVDSLHLLDFGLSQLKKILKSLAKEI